MTDDAEKSDVAKREETVLAFWKEKKIFEKSVTKQAPKGEFVFYDGPPFATGTPHSGSLLSSVSKDVIPRYKTMRGYRVRRRWGWDTHGLPIESLVEKKLGLKNKKEIFAIGVEKFNETARSMVLEYVGEWKRYVERVGRFVDFDNSYKTMDSTYTESVWWALKKIHEKGNLYEGRKVLLYCPHCETPLAKAEIAMDNTYQDVTEEAVTVKFKVKNPEKHGLPPNTFILAWTTTPWTLPGNVALAVGAHIEYLLFQSGDEHLIGAKELLPERAEHAAKKFFGKDLVGIEYEPPYEIAKVKAHSSKTKWTVVPADFVSTEEGTGVVHTAVIYGEDDYTLGVKEDLPMIPLLNPNGTYNDDAPEFVRGEYIKKAEKKIKEDLESRRLLYEKEMHTHSYPHCYRCGTPLIYNAVSSWFISMEPVRQKMLSENEKITWFPEHLKHGRFKHILESAPDWTISRNRFWASPLPIWKDVKGNVTVIGSLEELKKRTKKSGNRYFIMRHGEAESNVKKTLNSRIDISDFLTEKGREDARLSAQKLKDAGIDLIIASPFQRTCDTALIAANVLGLDSSAVIVDERLHEVIHGDYSEKPAEDYDRIYNIRLETFPDSPQGGESYEDVKRRMGNFLYNIETTYSGKHILIVSHGHPLSLLQSAALGLSLEESFKALHAPDYLEPGNAKELLFTPIPHNKDYELDYHLPYIDRVELADEKGETLTRIPEVVDCWVESGAMPFAEYHYPFENRSAFESHSPGDFVSEYIGQTRAWFYYMHAISTQLFGRLAFRNVVTTGTILAADGEKLSKSKKNFTDPYVLFDRFGADAFRYYLMSSVVMQAEDLTFRDEDVKEVYNRVINILRNTEAFYLLYADELAEGDFSKSPHLLDQWIRARLDETLTVVTESFDRYDMIRAARPFRDFVEDFSTWYVRRSRDRVKGTDESDKQYALHTLKHVLHTFSRIIAPVIPFIAEEIFQSVREDTEPESVHLCDWPEIHRSAFSFLKRFGVSRFSRADALINNMQTVRNLASSALMLRQKASIKVRQPLATLSVPEDLTEELRAVLADEVNVKEVIIGAPELFLDTTITEELKKEGELRDLVREIQDLRKQAGLEPREKATLIVPEDRMEAITSQWEKLAVATNLSRKETGASLHVRAS